MATTKEVTDSYWDYHEASADEHHAMYEFCQKYNIPEDELDTILQTRRANVYLYIKHQKLKEEWEAEHGPWEY